MFRCIVIKPTVEGVPRGVLRQKKASIAGGLYVSGAGNGTRVFASRIRSFGRLAPSHARWEMLMHFLSLATSRFESV